MGRFVRLARIVPDYGRTALRGWLGHRAPGRGPHRVAQAVVVGEEGVLLTVRAELRGWELPGGVVDPGELSTETVVREVREETGIDVEIEWEVGTWTRTGFLPHRVTVFRCRPVSGTPTPSAETPRVAWWDPQALPTATLFPWYWEPLAAGLSGEADPVERTEHQGLRAIAAGMAIDLRMRWSDDRTGGGAR